MRRWFLKVLLATAVLAAAALPHQARAQATPPPVEAFGRLPAVADAAISPDGSKVALAMSQGDAAIINVVDLNQRTRIYAGLLDENSQLRAIDWAADDLVSYVVSRTYHPGEVLPSYMRFRGRPTRVDYVRNGLLDLNTQRTRMLTINDVDSWADQGAYLIAPIEGDPGYGRMIGRAPGDSSTHPFVYRVSFQNGRSRSAGVRGINEDTIGYLIDERGQVIARSDSDRRSNRWRVYVYDDTTPRLLLEGVSEIGDPIDLQGLMDDGRLAAIDTAEDGHLDVLYAIDVVSGAREAIYARDDADISYAMLDPWTRRVVGVGWGGSQPGSEYFDPVLQAAALHVADLFEAGAGWLISWSRDRSRVLVYGELGLDGGAYYAYSPADQSIERISARYPELAGADIGVRQEITYPARDGVRIPAYLTLPAVANPESLPLVVLVHGGPHARDSFNFDWWSTFLASRGYAVLQANFRGSSGYGQAWEDAGRRQWGALMQTDVEDGVVALAQIGIIDPARACIVGASYGGYAALAGATLTPDRYQCAASIAGVSDLEAMLRQEALETGSTSMASDFWRQSIGDRSEDRERIRSVSPARLADRVQIPILLMHGTDDTVVPNSQTRTMLDRLRDNHKDVRFVELRGDDHWLSDAPTRTLMLRELETFLAANLGAPASR
jgi:dipeptidyl aminopeptidase/acylaminoacyl peptidase